MLQGMWPTVVGDARVVAGWIDTRVPASVPRWVWALLTVGAALVLGRIGTRILAGLMQLALLAAALLIAWQMVQTPAATRTAAPPACTLEGIPCHSSSVAGTPGAYRHPLTPAPQSTPPAQF
jgi:hypothetical protein